MMFGVEDIDAIISKVFLSSYELRCYELYMYTFLWIIGKLNYKMITLYICELISSTDITRCRSVSNTISSFFVIT